MFRFYKRFTLFVLISLICSQIVFSKESFITLNKFSLNQLKFGMGNDRWSNGISFNMDDQLTYSINIGADLGVVDIDMILEAYTNKDTKTRYDLIGIDATVPIGFKICSLNNSSTLFSAIKTGIGGFVYGNAGLQDIQNALHAIMGIYQLDLKYPDKTLFIPKVFLNAAISIKKSAFELSLYTFLDYKIGLEANEEAGIKAKADTFSAFLGYRGMQSLKSDKTLEKWVEKRSGMQVGYEIKKGVLDALYWTNPLTRQGYGNINISFFSPYIESQIKYHFGKTWYVFQKNYKRPVFENFNSIEIEYKNVFIATHFNTGIDGKPMDNGIFSLGYKQKLYQFIFIKPSVKFSHFSISKDDEELYFGFGANINLNIEFLKHYGLSFEFGGTYLISDEFLWSIGASIDLI